MSRRGKPWYLQAPTLIIAGATGFGALGTLIVKSAAYITLPDAIAGVKQENVVQGEAILELKKSNEIWQQIYQQQQQQQQAPSHFPATGPASAPLSTPPPGLRIWDDSTQQYWCCPFEEYDYCTYKQAWIACPH